jgi:hypothetical protein
MLRTESKKYTPQQQLAISCDFTELTHLWESHLETQKLIAEKNRAMSDQFMEESEEIRNYIKECSDSANKDKELMGQLSLKIGKSLTKIDKLEKQLKSVKIR